MKAKQARKIEKEFQEARKMRMSKLPMSDSLKSTMVVYDILSKDYLRKGGGRDDILFSPKTETYQMVKCYDPKNFDEQTKKAYINAYIESVAREIERSNIQTTTSKKEMDYLLYCFHRIKPDKSNKMYKEMNNENIDKLYALKVYAGIKIINHSEFNKIKADKKIEVLESILDSLNNLLCNKKTHNLKITFNPKTITEQVAEYYNYTRIAPNTAKRFKKLQRSHKSFFSNKEHKINEIYTTNIDFENINLEIYKLCMAKGKELIGNKRKSAERYEHYYKALENAFNLRDTDKIGEAEAYASSLNPMKTANKIITIFENADKDFKNNLIEHNIIYNSLMHYAYTAYDTNPINFVKRAFDTCIEATKDKYMIKKLEKQKTRAISKIKKIT